MDYKIIPPIYGAGMENKSLELSMRVLILPACFGPNNLVERAFKLVIQKEILDPMSTADKYVYGLGCIRRSTPAIATGVARE